MKRRKHQLIDQHRNLNVLCLVDVWLPVAWIVSDLIFYKETNCIFFTLALGGIHAEDEYNEANKRHTMSHPPDHIPEINNQAPAKAKSPKEKKEKEKKDKVKFQFFFYKKIFLCK